MLYWPPETKLMSIQRKTYIPKAVRWQIPTFLSTANFFPGFNRRDRPKRPRHRLFRAPAATTPAAEPQSPEHGNCRAPCDPHHHPSVVVSSLHSPTSHSRISTFNLRAPRDGAHPWRRSRSLCGRSCVHRGPKSPSASAGACAALDRGSVPRRRGYAASVTPQAVIYCSSCRPVLRDTD